MHTRSFPSTAPPAGPLHARPANSLVNRSWFTIVGPSLLHSVSGRGLVQLALDPRTNRDIDTGCCVLASTVLVCRRPDLLTPPRLTAQRVLRFRRAMSSPLRTPSPETTRPREPNASCTNHTRYIFTLAGWRPGPHAPNSLGHPSPALPSLRHTARIRLPQALAQSQRLAGPRTVLCRFHSGPILRRYFTCVRKLFDYRRSSITRTGPTRLPSMFTPDSLLGDLRPLLRATVPFLLNDRLERACQYM